MTFFYSFIPRKSVFVLSDKILYDNLQICPTYGTLLLTWPVLLHWQQCMFLCSPEHFTFWDMRFYCLSNDMTGPKSHFKYNKSLSFFLVTEYKLIHAFPNDFSHFLTPSVLYKTHISLLSTKKYKDIKTFSSFLHGGSKFVSSIFPYI